MKSKLCPMCSGTGHIDIRPVFNPVKQIAQMTADYYGVHLSVIEGESREMPARWPRHVAFYIASKLTNSSRYQIALALKKRDHGTVGNGITRIAAFLSIKPESIEARHIRDLMLRIHERLNKQFPPVEGGNNETTKQKVKHGKETRRTP